MSPSDGPIRHSSCPDLAPAFFLPSELSRVTAHVRCGAVVAF